MRQPPTKLVGWQNGKIWSPMQRKAVSSPTSKEFFICKRLKDGRYQKRILCYGMFDEDSGSWSWILKPFDFKIGEYISIVLPLRAFQSVIQVQVEAMMSGEKSWDSFIEELRAELILSNPSKGAVQ
tara:strand:- start:154 stop:531 length:378 start_codon:yes stop_codon:yes gene_type:complete